MAVINVVRYDELMGAKFVREKLDYHACLYLLFLRKEGIIFDW